MANYTKKSGAVYNKITKGEFVGGTIVNAWNYSQSRGMLTAVVYPYKNTEKYTPETTKRTKQKMCCKLHYHNSGVEKIIACSMDVSTKVISLPSIGMCISPNGSGKTENGNLVKGYFGTFNKK